ncbi:saccharopine dehydrogenase NADP-binding domain-containing protein [uncultured Roseobacter sp.]|uniref:saccharopine dehydrogenase family protein n=1 Tax=uncultured Roseobacter sp. TaxID=114847 RepID=UPI0026166C92|nr:saccharopine dehydrogenase NADP-binding domain-containing protein [uncultured Roseobacter sp.]
MANCALILGGYGNFGKRISAALAFKGIPVLIAGRNFQKASDLAKSIGPNATPLKLDIETELARAFKEHDPCVVVNTVGPFQGQGYDVARAAIDHKIHYIDLADGREFVTGINELDQQAQDAGVAIISGASTVPALSDAVVAAYASDFARIDLMKYGIAPGQGAERGLATTRAILGYVGRRLAPFRGIRSDIYGWQDIYRQPYPGLGARWMANCDVPDLNLLPDRHNIRTIQFSAGLELGLMHLGLWAISCLVRLGLPLPLERMAPALLSISNWLNPFGSRDGGMHVFLTGDSVENPSQQIERSWFIVARNGCGPHIPTIPAIILAARIAKGDQPTAGAMPCLGMVSLADYLSELETLDIETITHLRSIAP